MLIWKLYPIFEIFWDFLKMQIWTQDIRFLFWVRSICPDHAFLKSRIFLDFRDFRDFSWFSENADLDSGYTISILGEVDMPWSCFSENSDFSRFSRFWKFFVIFWKARFGLGIYDFYSGWGLYALIMLFWKVDFLKNLNFWNFSGLRLKLSFNKKIS